MVLIKLLYVNTFEKGYVRSKKMIELLKMNNVSILTLRILERSKKSILKIFTKYFMRLISLKIDGIIYHSDCFSPVLFLVKTISILKRIPLISKIDISGLLYALDRKKGRISTKRFLKNFISDKLRVSLSNYVIFITKTYGNYLCERFNYSKKKILSLYHGANENVFEIKRN